MASVYADLTAAAEMQGEMVFPDGKKYAVAGLPYGHYMKVLALTTAGANTPDGDAVAILAAAARACCSVPDSVFERVTPTGLERIVTMAMYGAEAAAAALSKEAAAEGNGRPAVKSPARSTTRSKR